MGAGAAAGEGGAGAAEGGASAGAALFAALADGATAGRAPGAGRGPSGAVAGVTIAPVAAGTLAAAVATGVVEGSGSGIAAGGADTIASVAGAAVAAVSLCFMTTTPAPMASTATAAAIPPTILADDDFGSRTLSLGCGSLEMGWVVVPPTRRSLGADTTSAALIVMGTAPVPGLATGAAVRTPADVTVADVPSWWSAMGVDATASA